MGFGACATQADGNQRGISQRQGRLTNLSKPGFEISVAAAGILTPHLPRTPGRGDKSGPGENARASFDHNFSNRVRTFPAIMRAMGIADVAAGEGALHTCSCRSASAKRKSFTRGPSRNTAWARIPAI